MIKNVLTVIAVMFFVTSSAQEKKSISRAIEPTETKYDTIKIVNEEVEYEITILEVGFDSWLVTQLPMWYYENSTLATKNYFKVVEWNQRVLDPFRYDPMLYQQRIDYSPFIDYGLEVNYLLFMYFRFFEQKYHVRLGIGSH